MLLCRYAKGSEVFNSYGRRQNDNLLLDYGFALLDNEWDHLEFPFRLLSPNASLADSWATASFSSSSSSSSSSGDKLDESRLCSQEEPSDDRSSLDEDNGKSADAKENSLFDEEMETYHMKLMLIRNDRQTTIRTLKIERDGLPIEVRMTSHHITSHHITSHHITSLYAYMRYVLFFKCVYCNTFTYN
jgi:hypothetical protein